MCVTAEPPEKLPVDFREIWETGALWIGEELTNFWK